MAAFALAFTQKPWPDQLQKHDLTTKRLVTVLVHIVRFTRPP
jgi:hypothetical protein